MKVFLAGVELFYGKYRNQPDVYNLLADSNHFYCYNNKKACTEAVKIVPGRIRICDSGAYFYIHKHRAEEVKFKELGVDSGKFVVNYIKWIQRNWDSFDYFVEFDLQELLPYEMIVRWRKLFDRAQISEKMIYVMHKDNTMDEWKEMVDSAESRYCGISKLHPWMSYTRYIKYAYDNQCKVHGFAMTRPAQTLEYPFYSVDSATWYAVALFGQTVKWDSALGAVKEYQSGANVWTKKNMAYLLKRGIPSWYKDTKNERVLIHKIQNSVKAYVQWEQHLKKYWAQKGVVWHD